MLNAVCCAYVKAYVGGSFNLRRAKMLYGSSLSRIRLLGHIVEYLKQWTPNERGLLFATRNGTPWDANLVVSGSCSRCSSPLGSSGAFYTLSVTPTVRSWIAWACRSRFASNVSGTVILRSRWAYARMWRARTMYVLRSSWMEFCTQLHPKTKTARGWSTLSRCI